MQPTESTDTAQPLHDREAERAVLGAILMDTDVLVRVMPILGNTPDAFFTTAHQNIYTAVLDIYEQHQKADILLVADQLKKTGQLKRVGGIIYLYDLQERIVETKNTEFHAGIVHDKWKRRQFIQTSAAIREIAHDEEKPLESVIDETQRLILEKTHQTASRDYTPFYWLLPDLLADIEEAKHKELVGIPTGFTDYDILTQGLQPGEMTVIAGRPGMGKSTLVTNIAQHIAFDQNLPIAIFSLEMPKKQVGMRILAAEIGFPLSELRTGKLPYDSEVKLADTAASLQNGARNILINDDSLLNVPSLRVKARRMKTENPNLAAIIVDHLQIMRPTRDAQPEYEMITEISRELKALASELNISVVVCSQLNREVERKPDKRPNLADLRGSGGIEQDADVVAFLYRDEYYNDTTDQPGIAELLVRKHRNGPTDDITLQFDPAIMRFRNNSTQEATTNDEPTPTGITKAAL